MVLNLITYAYLVVAMKIGCEHIRIESFCTCILCMHIIIRCVMDNGESFKYSLSSLVTALLFSLHYSCVVVAQCVEGSYCLLPVSCSMLIVLGVFTGGLLV